MRRPTTPRRRAVAPLVSLTALVVGLALVAAPRLAAADPGAEQGEALLRRAMVALQEVPHDARLVVASLGPDGPSLREDEVRSRPGDAAALAVLDVDRLLERYRVTGTGQVSLGTGAARVVRVARGDGPDRERLFVDEATGLLVRREVFDGRGRPVRVVALTDLTIVAQDRAADTEGFAAIVAPMPDAEVDAAALGILDATGWHVPDELGGMALVAGYAADQGPDGSVLHLRYDDGLYSVSLYEQVGVLDGDAVEGAAPLEVAGGTAWHWPGATPERIVLSGDGVTFTAVSDAPLDVLVDALADLPNDQRPSVVQRMAHGARRLASWAWPLG